MDGTLLSDPVRLDPVAAEAFLASLGTGTVARLTYTPTSTVDSWRTNGMSKARFDHVRLAAQARGKADELATAMQALAELDADPELPFDEAEAG